VISQKGIPLQAGKRWVVERTNSWHNRGFRKLALHRTTRPRHQRGVAGVVIFGFAEADREQ
jgi:hypothetical protein